MADRRVATMALGAALALGAAAPAPPPRAAAVWTVDKAASRLGFRGEMAGKPFDGVFKRWDAQLAFDAADLAASHLQMSVETASAVTGDPVRDVALPSVAGLGAVRFPRAVFTSRGFVGEGGSRYRVSGVLTLHGVARPVDVQATVEIVRDRLTLTGAFPLDRRAFGVGPPGDPSGGVVQVQARLAARRAG